MGDFIEKYNKDATGNVVSMQRQDLENASDVSPILNIKNSFEYVWNPDDPRGKKTKNINSLFLKTKSIGKYYFRSRPCYCIRCRHSSDRPCIHEASVGKWYSQTQKYKGKRSIKIRSVVEDNTDNRMDEDNIDQ